MNEAFKRALLNSSSFYQARRWEGQPLLYKIKYLFANRSEFAFCIFSFALIMPSIVAYKYFTYDESRGKAMKKYRPIYIVVRDDDPDLQSIIDEKEFGRHFFPEY